MLGGDYPGLECSRARGGGPHPPAQHRAARRRTARGRRSGRRLVGRLAGRDRRGREALTHLAGDDVRHYRALWQYVLASWAEIAAQAGDRDQRHDLTDLADFSPVGTA